MKNCISIICLILILISCNKEKTKILVDVPNIARGNLASVEKVLGKGVLIDKINSNNTTCGDCPKYSFNDGAIEIVFIENKADWITIKASISGKPFDDNIIKSLGFPNYSATFKNDNVIKWSDIQGYNEISVFQDFENKGFISYAYIKVLTK